MSRVLAVGLDGAEAAYVETLLDAGLLPSLGRLRAAGTWHRLTTEPPWRQGFAFNQFLAGRAPAPGDAWDVCRFDPAHYRPFKPMAVGQLGGPPFYERVPGMRTILFDVPWSAIGSSPDTVEVVAWGTHSPHYPRASRPKGLLTEIDRRVGLHPGFLNSWSAQWHDEASLDRLVEASVVGAHRRAEALAILLEGFPDWELAIVVMSETHDAGELLWHGVDPNHPLADCVDTKQASARLEAIYRGVDEALGALVARCPEDTSVVVFSLFGSCSGPGDVPSSVLLAELLARLAGQPARLRSGDGAWRAEGCPPVVPRRSEDWQEALDRLWTAPAPPSGPLRAPSRPPAFTRPRPVGHEASRVGAFGQPIPGEQGPPAAEEVELGEALDWQVAARYRGFWPAMRAFALPSFSEGMVRINLVGREADGVVAPADYEAACDEVEAAVRVLVNPRTGRRAVKEVVRAPLDRPSGEARYADLVVVWDGPTDAFEHPATGVIGPVPLRRLGAHTDHAFGLVCGDVHATAAAPAGSGVGRRGRPGSILDLPPTFLSLLGRPIPEALDGTPLVGSRRARRGADDSG